jgi:hypothetical protein
MSFKGQGVDNKHPLFCHHKDINQKHTSKTNHGTKLLRKRKSAKIAHPYRTREKRERKGEREGERGRVDTKDKKQKPEKTQVQ